MSWMGFRTYPKIFVVVLCATIASGCIQSNGDGKSLFTAGLLSSNGGALSERENAVPLADAGPNHSIQFPVASVTLEGSGSDPDGTIVSYSWSQIIGPNTATFSNSSNATTTVSDLVVGVYVFRLEVTDDYGSKAHADASVVVSAADAPNLPPVANAGVDLSIQLPISSVSLVGSGTDPDGTIVSYAWSQVSGPGNAVFSSANTASTTASNLMAGTYVFRLTVQDNDGSSATDDVSVSVAAAPVASPTPSPTPSPVPSPTPSPTPSPSPCATAPVPALSGTYANQCALCHGNNGQGGAFQSLKGNLTEIAYIQTVRTGRGAMPAFSSAQISDATLKSDYRFLYPLPLCPSPKP